MRLDRGGVQHVSYTCAKFQSQYLKKAWSDSVKAHKCRHANILAHVALTYDTVHLLS